MDETIDQRVVRVFQNQFRLSADVLSDDLHRGELEVWDSLSHVVLVDALNREFGIRIPPEEALEIETVRDAKRAVQTLINS